MSIESDSKDMIGRLGLTPAEVSVARRAAKLIRKYRLENHGLWSGPTADQLVRQEIGDPSRQISVLSLACLVEKETRTPASPPEDLDS